MEIRRQLIEDSAVDVIVAVGPNMFYTVTLPCTLWFLDRGKAKTDRAARVLFVDARHIYRQVDRAHRDWTDAQIEFIANIVRLYRDQDIDFTVGDKAAGTRLLEVFGKKPRYRDVTGLCKVVPISKIASQIWSLNPGRYVGTAPGESVGDEEFLERFEALTEEFEALSGRAAELTTAIARSAADLLATEG